MPRHTFPTDQRQPIVVRTRTGGKTHLATSPTTSMIACGRWLKFQACQYWVRGPVTCEQCRAARPDECADAEAYGAAHR